MLKKNNPEAHKDLNIKKRQMLNTQRLSIFRISVIFFSIKQFQLLNRIHIIHLEPEQNVNRVRLPAAEMRFQETPKSGNSILFLKQEF